MIKVIELLLSIAINLLIFWFFMGFFQIVSKIYDWCVILIENIIRRIKNA